MYHKSLIIDKKRKVRRLNNSRDFSPGTQKKPPEDFFWGLSVLI